MLDGGLGTELIRAGFDIKVKQFEFLTCQQTFSPRSVNCLLGSSIMERKGSG